MGMIKSFEALVECGNDNAMVHYSLGNIYFTCADYPRAADHFRQAVRFDPDYSAGWKMYGQALEYSNVMGDAVAAYETGLQVAEKNGDLRLVKEIRVYIDRVKG